MKQRWKRTAAVILSAATLLGGALPVLPEGVRLFEPTLTAGAADLPSSGTLDGGLTWTLNEGGVLTISGSGDMPDFTDEASPFYGAAGVSALDIGEGVTSIGSFAFQGCENMEYCMLPTTLTAIGDGAFQDCSLLCDVCFPESVTRIGDEAFANCSQLQTLNIPENVTEIGAHAFAYCTNLTAAEIAGVTEIAEGTFLCCTSLENVIMPDGVTRIGHHAFAGCTAMWSVYIPGSVWEISDCAFENCISLENVGMPGDVTSIGQSAFARCTALQTVELPDSVTEIADRSFFGCTSLENVNMPNDVTRIGDHAFADCTAMCSVYIPGSVWEICDCAFENCTALQMVDIQDGVNRIGDHAFADCTALQTVNLPGSVETIGEYAFADCTALSAAVISEGIETVSPWSFSRCTSLQSVTLPDSLRVIEGNAFFNCAQLTSVTIPESVNSIEVQAFGYCTSLTSVTIPENVQWIQQFAFDGCSALSSVIVQCSAGTYLGQGAFDYTSEDLCIIVPYEDMETFRTADGWSSYADRITAENLGSGTCGDDLRWTLFTNGTLVISGTGAMDDADHDFGWNDLRSSITNAVIEEGVTSIGLGAFRNCPNLTSVSLPDGLQSIGTNAFANCTGLTAVTVPESVKTIGLSAFWQCEGLTEVNLPESMSDIGKNAFYGCSALTAVTIPNGITEIAEGTFFCCESLESVTIPDTVKIIGKKAFIGCSSLTNVVIPESVTTIGDSAFDSTGLTAVTVPDNTIYIGDSAFANCSALTSAVLPDGLESLGAGAFQFCNELASCQIPAGLTCIEDSTFRGCNKLENVIIPAGVTSIGNYAFYSCKKLTSVTVPENVALIGTQAFYNCTELQTAAVLSTTPPELGENAFPTETLLCVPADSMNEYSSHWAAYAGNLTPCGSCGEHILWTLQDGTLTLLGRGDMYDYSDGAPGWADSSMGIERVVIGSGITSIGARAFYGCFYLSSVSIPDSVTSIGGSAFADCKSLTKITLPAGLTSIGSNAFVGCAMQSVTVPESVTSIGSEAFAYCTSLTSVSIPDSVTSIGHHAFAYCSSLTEVTLPAGLTSIDDSAFRQCSSLKNITLPAGLTSIGSNAFAACTSLTSVSIPGSVTSISYYAFYDCSSLTEIIIPAGVTGIGSYAFADCTSLTSVSIPESVEYFGTKAFAQTAWLTAKQNENPLVTVNGILLDGTTASGDVILPDGLTAIAEEAFKGNNNLTSVTVPDSVTDIYGFSFADCPALTAVFCKRIIPAFCYDTAFDNHSDGMKIYVPAAAVEDYRTVWSSFADCIEPYPAPAITAQPHSATNVIGYTAAFTVAAEGEALSYQWQYNKGDGWKTSNGTGSKTDTLRITIAAGYNGYRYRCVVSNSYGSKSISNAVTLKVKTKITAQPANQSKPIGEAAQFTVKASGAGLTYQWQYNKGDGWKNSNGTGSKTDTLTINTAAGYNGYQYRCIINNTNNQPVTSAAATLRVKTVITSQPNGIRAAIGDTAQFTVAASGVGLKYQWQYNSGDGWKKSGASGATTATLSIYAKTTYHGWKYRCVITDANGAKTTSSVATLKIKAAITAQPANVSAAIGDTALFTVKATGIGLSYQWQYNNGEGWKNSGASGNKTAELTLYSKTAYNGWQFRCVVTDEIGTKVISSAAVFTVKTKITAQPASIEAASGTAAKFTVKATGLDLSYQWQYNSGSGWKNSNGTGATTAALTINAKSTYNNWQYRCVITDGNGAKTYSDAAKLTVK